MEGAGLWVLKAIFGPKGLEMEGANRQKRLETEGANRVRGPLTLHKKLEMEGANAREVVDGGCTDDSITN